MNTYVENRIVYSALFCIVFCFVFSFQERVLIQVNPKEVLELRQKAQECSQKTGVPAVYLKKLVDKTWPDDRPSREFFHCVIHETGYMLHNGQLVLEKMLVLKLVNGTKEAYLNDLNECSKIKKGDDIDTAFAINQCIHGKFLFEVSTSLTE